MKICADITFQSWPLLEFFFQLPHIAVYKCEQSEKVTFPLTLSGGQFMKMLESCIHAFGSDMIIGLVSLVFVFDAAQVWRKLGTLWWLILLITARTPFVFLYNSKKGKKYHTEYLGYISPICGNHGALLKLKYDSYDKVLTKVYRKALFFWLLPTIKLSFCPLKYFACLLCHFYLSLYLFVFALVFYLYLYSNSSQL